MKFGPLPVPQTLGHTLAHSFQRDGLRLAKGHVITQQDIVGLHKRAVRELTVAQFDPDDLQEDAAAAELAAGLSPPMIRVTQPMNGRVNLIATRDGVLRVNAASITGFNTVDPAITIATLPAYARVHDGTMIATIKIIPYAVPRVQVEQAAAMLTADSLMLHPFRAKTARLILTRTSGFKPSLLAKGEAAVRARAVALGLTLQGVETVDHTQDAIGAAIARAGGADMVLILGASATSDPNDVAPAGLVDAGGTLTRFGMPVDPGNLLFLGDLHGKPVIGLPGCCRSPALNGVDWVLERLMANLPVSHDDIALMGVGGLLKEVPARPQPRRIRSTRKAQAPHVLLLAAGQSSRMRGDHKLLREIDGVPLVRRTADRLLGSSAGGLSIVINPANKAVKDALTDCPAQLVPAKDAASGLAASLRAGINALPPEASAVIIALADMPEVTGDDIDALIGGFDPAQGALIVAPVAPNGKRGNPVLFDKRYFESLASFSGDSGAKSLIEAESDSLRLVPRGAGVLVDLDTPEAWDAWMAQYTRT
ncbi:NTP transferase domain-containing protein [Neptunicoccus cionae]|uniref:4-diphosphocytidyl-2C-methyl-D-erythritol kinase n=1 Tax=Neptunicoccus cionae TaxID=2035344 RepID=A0A916VTN1_9RHOB|nr:molybdopterin-binding/glycosyltransferase family 2 protein [Amylibacter cionae]GGA33778.1 4-diphosphocytidyl-2C-methyl-D-erythritol kinase [Amylibacter cionae]